VWLGYRAFVAPTEPIVVEARGAGSPWRRVGLGLLVTLGNPKAILFYGALLPTFLDMTTIGIGAYLVLAAIVVGVSCMVYGGYMVPADRTRRLMSSTRAVKRLNRATGTMLIGSGILVATR
jgi:threonine/homoserine/homoserine lactone efflux protein